MRTPAQILAGTWFGVYPPDHDLAGRVIDRAAVCACRRQFTQYQLSVSQCAAWERLGVMPNVLRQIPELYVPVHCPGCESKDLGRQAQIDAARGPSSHTMPDSRRDW